jgi:hypothetical protein
MATVEQLNLVEGLDVLVGVRTFGHFGALLEELIHLELGLLVQVLVLEIRGLEG